MTSFAQSIFHPVCDKSLSHLTLSMSGSDYSWTFWSLCCVHQETSGGLQVSDTQYHRECILSLFTVRTQTSPPLSQCQVSKTGRTKQEDYEGMKEIKTNNRRTDRHTSSTMHLPASWQWAIINTVMHACCHGAPPEGTSVGSTKVCRQGFSCR